MFNIARTSLRRIERQREILLRSLTSSPKNSEGTATAKSEVNNSVGAADAWRKEQLVRLEHKFQKDSAAIIEKEEDLQPEWKNLERRVLTRQTRTKVQLGGKSGRRNVKSTDEDAWLQAGLYQVSNNKTENK